MELSVGANLRVCPIRSIAQIVRLPKLLNHFHKNHIINRTGEHIGSPLPKNNSNEKTIHYPHNQHFMLF
jgi:hypothetical protein